MADRYTKLTKAIPNSKTNATTIARIFLEKWVANYGILSKLLSDNGPKFAEKFFMEVCSTLGVDNIPITQYQRPTNSQAEHFHSTLISRLLRYASEHYTGWDTYLLQPMHAYNVQVYRSITVSPFSLALTKTTPWTDHCRIKTP